MSPLSSIRSRGAALVAIAALAGAGLVALGCGGSDDGDDGGSAPAVGASGLPKLDGETISYVGFGGSTDEAFQKTIFAEFEEKTGAKVILDSPTDYKKVQAQVESGSVQYDIVDGDPYVMDPQCGDQWEPLTGVDTKAIDPAFKSGTNCTVADYGYYLQIASDTDSFGNEGPQTCEDFFDTQQFPGKRAIWSYVEASAAIECAAIAAGADPKDPYPIDLDKAFAKLESIKEDLVTYSTSSDAVDKMQNGDVAVSLVTARMVAEALNSDAPVAASKAWIGRFWGSFGIPSGAPHADAAKALLGYMARRNVNPLWLKESGGGVSNVTDPIRTANAAGNLPSPDEIEKIATDVDWEWWAENDPEVIERFGALTTG